MNFICPQLSCLPIAPPKGFRQLNTWANKYLKKRVCKTIKFL